MVNNIRQDEIPEPPTHYLGVGAVVLNEKLDKILLGYEPRWKMWKVPTGLADKKETIKMAVIRELKEETGINADFKGIISFWEAFPMTFGFSDIYFNCLLIANEN